MFVTLNYLDFCLTRLTENSDLERVSSFTIFPPVRHRGGLINLFFSLIRLSLTPLNVFTLKLPVTLWKTFLMCRRPPCVHTHRVLHSCSLVGFGDLSQEWIAFIIRQKRTLSKPRPQRFDRTNWVGSLMQAVQFVPELRVQMKAANEMS